MKLTDSDNCGELGLKENININWVESEAEILI